MSANPTPLPGDTWHIDTDELYPAIMNKLGQLADEVSAFRKEVENLRTEVRGLRYAALGFISVVLLGALVVGIIATLRR